MGLWGMMCGPAGDDVWACGGMMCGPAGDDVWAWGDDVWAWGDDVWAWGDDVWAWGVQSGLGPGLRTEAGVDATTYSG